MDRLRIFIRNLMTGLSGHTKALVKPTLLVITVAMVTLLAERIYLYSVAYHQAAVQAAAVYQFLTEPVGRTADGKPISRADVIRQQYPTLAK